MAREFQDALASGAVLLQLGSPDFLLDGRAHRVMLARPCRVGFAVHAGSPITGGGAFSVGILLAIEQPNKKDSGRDSQNVEHITDAAGYSTTTPKPIASIVAHIKPAPAIGEAFTICSRISRIGSSFAADMRRKHSRGGLPACIESSR